MCWELAEDEALIVEFDPGDGFWMMSMMGVFFTSMDYLYRPVSYTPARTRLDRDGKVRLILCHRDPGYHNWLDTQGFGSGNLTYRKLLSTQGTSFNTLQVKVSELATALPAGSATILPEERTKQLLQRFQSIHRRYCL